MACDFYAQLFTAEPTTDASDYISGCFPSLSSMEMESLHKIPEMAEIREAVFNIGAMKSPGPDGLHALFFQSQWNVIQQDICQWVVSVFQGTESLEEVNETLLCLIPKVNNPTNMTQFRPIGLCNVTYKIISKILVQRLKGLMPKLVSHEQSSFIPGRHMNENILIAQETLHSFHTKRGKTGFMAIKVDLEKAYDRVDWGFLHNTLHEVGFPENFRQLVMNCVQTTSMEVLWNGARTTRFKPQRGVRQGDPLSPYLFILCLERLSHKIGSLVAEGRWKPMRFANTGPLISHMFFADDMLLLAEANTDQAELIKAVLQEFCDVSGQKVSASKTKVLFSRNIPLHNQHSLSTCLGFTKTDDLGKYLGMPLVQGRVTNRTYEDLINKIDKRLSGWKAEKLSLAGRITLAKTVLTAIPSFAMQSTKIPVGICDLIDRKIRKFIWGSTSEARKTSLVAWEKICRPKECGGLGFRSLRTINEAYLMKLVWGILTKPEDLWVRVFRSKYGKQPWSEATLQVRGKLSYQWRAILSVWDKAQLGKRWRLGNGHATSFWNDAWLDGGQPLNCLVPESVLTENADVPVAYYVSASGQWEWNQMPLLPAEVYLQIAAMKPPSPFGPPDHVAWGPTQSGIFTLSSALELIDPVFGEIQVVWQCIWKWPGPQRIRMFLWLCAHNALLTNEKRGRMGIVDAMDCPRCSASCESTMHVLRDCFFIKSIWQHIVEQRHWQLFCGLELHDWLHLALTTNLGKSSVEEWLVLFGVTMWLGWRWRNEFVFGEQGVIGATPLDVIWKFTRDIQIASKARVLPGTGGVLGQLIGWKPPANGWIKVNTDGAQCNRRHMATAGGVLRDHNGNWISGFMHNIGACSANLAELWGAYNGLQLAWKRGHKHVYLELDSLALVNMLQRSEPSSESASVEVMVNTIKLMLQRDWDVQICHTLREGNKCADWLATNAFQVPLGYHLLGDPPQQLKSFLLSDVLGLQWPRGA